MDHPKILISALFIDPGKVGGAENYLSNLLKGLVQHAGKENIKLAIDSNLKYDPYLDSFDCYHVNVRYNRRLYDLGMPFKSEYWNADVLFLPNYISPLFKRKKSTRVVTTFHDLQFFHSKEIDSRLKRIWLRLTYLHTLSVADKVICISQYVKDDLVDKFGKKYEKKIEVIPNPIDFDRFKHQPKKKEFDYILSVNALYPNKNTISLIKAFQICKRLDPDLPKLVLVGQLSKNLSGNDYSSYGEKIKQAIAGDPDILLTGYIKEAELGWWYANASLFVNPSLFEGFGMTPVEAMGYGIPTLTSGLTSLREVTLGKAIYLTQPNNPERIANQIIEVISNLEHHRQTAMENSTLVRATYSPTRIAEMYFQVFKNPAPSKINE